MNTSADEADAAYLDPSTPEDLWSGFNTKTCSTSPLPFWPSTWVRAVRVVRGCSPERGAGWSV